jgi:hypothetical protein
MSRKVISIVAVLLGGVFLAIAIKAKFTVALVLSILWIILGIVSLRTLLAFRILKWLAIFNVVDGLYVFVMNIVPKWDETYWPMTLMFFFVALVNVLMVLLFDMSAAELKEVKMKIPLATVAISIGACFFIFFFHILPSKPTSDAIKASFRYFLRNSGSDAFELDKLMEGVKVEIMGTEGGFTKAYVTFGDEKRLEYFYWQNVKWTMLNLSGGWDDVTCKQLKIPESLWPGK